MVSQPTRITETTENILDLFFTNNSSLINTAEVIPGISDHEAVFIEASLRPYKTNLPLRTVYVYKKADYDDINEGLRNLHKDMSQIVSASVDKLWTMFKNRLAGLMKEHIPTKSINGRKTKKPWIDRRVRSAIRKRARLYTRMKKKKKKKKKKKEEGKGH